MIRRSPAENYIKYLLVHPDNYDDEDIACALREHQLDFPGGKYLPRLRSRMKKPKIFHPFNETHAASYRFLVSHKIHTLFFPDKTTKAALNVLGSARAKEAVEAMTLVGDPLAQISVRLERIGIGKFPIPVLQRYCHYFWNTDLVDTAEMAALLEKRVNEAMFDVEDDKTSALVATAVKKAKYNDARYMAASTAFPLLASMRIQLRFGYMPSRVDTARMAEVACQAGVLAAAGAIQAGGPRAAQDYANYALGASKMKELMDSFGSVNAQVAQELQALTVETTGESPPDIHELTGGDYTEGSVSYTEKTRDE